VTSQEFREHLLLAAETNLNLTSVNITLRFNLSTINQGTATLFYCSSWDFEERSCTGFWQNLTNQTDFTENYTYISAESFSAYIIGEVCEESCGSWGGCSGGLRSRTCIRRNCESYMETESCNTGSAGLPGAVTVGTIQTREAEEPEGVSTTENITPPETPPKTNVTPQSQENRTSEFTPMTGRVTESSEKSVKNKNQWIYAIPLLISVLILFLWKKAKLIKKPIKYKLKRTER